MDAFFVSFSLRILLFFFHLASPSLLFSSLSHLFSSSSILPLATALHWSSLASSSPSSLSLSPLESMDRNNRLKWLFDPACP